MCLDPLQPRVAPQKLHDRQLLLVCLLLVRVTSRFAPAEARDERLFACLEFFVVHLPAEDKVTDIVAEVGHLGRRARAASPQRQVEPERGLRLEVGIADLKCEVAVVLAEEI